MITKTAYESLEEVANITDYEQRQQAIRDLFLRNSALSIVVHRTYHPNYNWDLVKGPLPEAIAKKSGHTEAGPFYHSIKRWNIFRTPEEVPANGNIKKSVRESQFIALYEAVSSLDADLLIAVKDKKLPWETLSCEFIVDSFPELFPDSFRQSVKNGTIEAKPKTATIQPPIEKPEESISKIDICKGIMQKNPGLMRKDYIKLFEEAGVSKVTGGQYYQKLKDVI